MDKSIGNSSPTPGQQKSVGVPIRGNLCPGHGGNSVIERKRKIEKSPPVVFHIREEIIKTISSCRAVVVGRGGGLCCMTGEIPWPDGPGE